MGQNSALTGGGDEQGGIAGIELGIVDDAIGSHAFAAQYAHHLDAGGVVADFANEPGVQALPCKSDGRVGGTAAGIEINVLNVNFGPQRKLLHIVTTADIAAGMEGLASQEHVLSSSSKC